MPFEMWLAFATAWFVLSLAPGPDNIFVLMQSVIYGKRDGLWVVVGLCMGLTVHIILVSVGVSALIRASEIAFTAVKVLGACYLVYLAVLAWRAPTQEISLDGKKKRTEMLPAWSLIRRGALMNLTNPKVIIFFLAFFPQFLVEGYSIPIQNTIMGITIIATCLLVFGGIAICADKVRALITSAKVQRNVNRTGAFVFVCLALNIVFTR